MSIKDINYKSTKNIPSKGDVTELKSYLYDKVNKMFKIKQHHNKTVMRCYRHVLSSYY